MIAAEIHAAPYWGKARQTLEQTDPILGNLIRAAGAAALRPRNDPFLSLSRSIVAQQLSVHAANSVWSRLIAHVGAMTPASVSSETEDTLRSCGLSRPKARYLLSLANHFTNRALDERLWYRMDDEAIIEQLIQVKGIGRWTAEMFLIFYLLRPDILPLADVASRGRLPIISAMEFGQALIRLLRSRSLGVRGDLSPVGISGEALMPNP